MSSGYIPASLQRRVRERAGDRCEYCGLAQAHQEATFHVDHVVPRRDGGPTTFGNLALACVSCSLRKGAKSTATDPDTAVAAALFDPRRHAWGEHFIMTSDFVIVGRTPTGRATAHLLCLNRALAIAIRREEAGRDR